MPRIEDDQLPVRKFKKRRAWIVPEEEINSSETVNSENSIDLTVTRVEHDYNKSVTRLEHEYNKIVTRIEQSKDSSQAIIQDSENRVEHDYNKSITRLEHEYNKSVTEKSQNIFYEFLDKKKLNLDSFDMIDPLYLITSLSDAQKRIFWHIALECISRKNSRTRPIEIKSFFASLAISIGVVRTTLNRLVGKRIIQREQGKLGKNGFAIIALPKMIFDAAQIIFNDFNNNK
jgi:hypothetical protein